MYSVKVYLFFTGNMLKFFGGRKEIIAMQFVYSENHRIYVRGILTVQTKYGVFSVRNGGAYSDICLLLVNDGWMHENC
jgi:hypothetical protein